MNNAYQLDSLMQLCIILGMNTLKDTLAELRETMSQEDIAKAIGVSQSKISRWGAGHVSGAAHDAIKLIELARRVREQRSQKESA